MKPNKEVNYLFEPTPITQIASFAEEYEFLSNFYLSEVELDGLKYPSVEHAYQAAKTLIDDERKNIQLAVSPHQSKKLGRKATLRKDWDEIKIDVMTNLLRQKFSKPYLKEKLLSTGNVELIEGNWWGDTFWGVCKGVGENNLGKVLMKIREELRN